MELRRYLTIGSFSLAGVLTLSVLDLVGHKWRLSPVNGVLTPRLSTEFLLVPVAFLLWVRVMEKHDARRYGGRFRTTFSQIACTLSLGGFAATWWLAPQPDACASAFSIGMIAGLFVFVPFQECLCRAARRKRVTLVALTAALAAYSYYTSLEAFWDVVCDWTMHTTNAILHLFGTASFVAVHPKHHNVFIIASKYFVVQITPNCSGLEGIFLVTFLLSILFLWDWPLFNRRRIALLYACGVLYMFFVNAPPHGSLFRGRLLGLQTRSLALGERLTGRSGSFVSFLCWSGSLRRSLRSPCHLALSDLIAESSSRRQLLKPPRGERSRLAPADLEDVIDEAFQGRPVDHE